MTEIKEKTSVLFVCMGNICRSPTAEGVFRKLVADAGLAERIQSDSAGTHAFHTGSAPDRRAQAAAERRGFMLSDIRSRPITADDFERHDYILAMDLDNLEILHEHAGDEHGSKVMLLLQFAEGDPQSEVPDPYYGGSAGFERVLDLVEQASRALLETLQSEIKSTP
jgi:protein-tyrosine phosphatase